MNKCTAIVLSGGGSRGALQVGALRALLESGVTPDLLVGTSIGAANALGLALWGADESGLQRLEQTWLGMYSTQVMDSRMGQLAMRFLLGAPSERTRKRAEAYFASLGITADLRFDQMKRTRCALVGADLNSGEPILYGLDPSERVLPGLIASMSIPPWFAPVEGGGHIVMDGGALCNLPIEPALRLGATEIIALDLDDPGGLPEKNLSAAQLFQKYLFAVNRRHIQLETRLARLQGVPVRRIPFRGVPTCPLWDFSHAQEYFATGYTIAQAQLSTPAHAPASALRTLEPA
jgi:NTE family protein